MKKYLTALLCTAVLSGANAKPLEGKDATKIQVQVSVNKASKLWLGVEKPAEQSVELTVFDDNQRIVYRQFYSKGTPTLVQKFDLKDLYDGEYSLYIRSGNEVIRKTFSIQTNPTTSVTLK